MRAKSFLPPTRVRRVIGGVAGVVVVAQLTGRPRSPSSDSLPDGLGDGAGPAVAGGVRSVRGLGVLAVAATAAFALPAYRRFASARATTGVDQQP